MSKLRADVALVTTGQASSRQKAQAFIMAGQVYYKEVKITKASEWIEDSSLLHIRGQVHPFVGRGALKLDKAVHTFSLQVEGLICLDIGAATGGFSDVLLQNGAKHVYAVDVGYGQLDWKIRNDERVTVLERTNARYLTHEQIPQVPDITVMDVSFISVKKLLPVCAMLMEDEGFFAILIKPQFEAGREHVGKKGVVREPSVHEAVIADIASFVSSMDYTMTNLDFSPITGPEGNIEYICTLYPVHRSTVSITHDDINTVVKRAHTTLR